MTDSLMQEVQIHLVDDVDDVNELMSWMSTRNLVAIDTETTGLNPETDTVRLVQIGDDRDAWVLRADRWTGVIEQIIRQWKGEYIGHNIKYDVAMLRGLLNGLTLPVDRCHDTRALSHLLEPDLSSGLKNAAARHVDPRAAALDRQLHESFRSAGWSWDTVPVDFQPYWAYAGVDTILTYRLFEVLKPRVLPTASRAYELELAVMWVLERMERNGVPIDREYAQGVESKLDHFVDDTQHWCEREHGVRAGSNAAVIKRLMEFGFEFTKATQSGALALDREVLESVDHPLAQTVLARRQAQKIASTYLKHFLADTPDGRLHPHINPLGARTGRMSMSNPNFQNLPRDARRNPAGHAVRNCVRASEDHVLLSCDFSQIEFRVLAHLSEDPGLLDAFRQPEDFFTVLARNIYSDSTITKSDPRRQPTKNAGYAKLYGAGAEKFALTAGITTADAHKIMAALDRSYPGIHGLQQKIATLARQRTAETGTAYVTSPFTGRRHPSDPGKEYTLVNYLVQGSAGELFKQKLVELDLAGLGEYMLLPVHDEVICEFPKADAAELTHEVENVMNDDTLLRVPITASASLGERWGELEK